MMIELTKVADEQPVAIAADQVVRVHGRTGHKGQLWAEVYVAGVRKPIGVRERYDQVMAKLRGQADRVPCAITGGPLRRDEAAEPGIDIRW